jgi:hypothetical protein
MVFVMLTASNLLSINRCRSHSLTLDAPNRLRACPQTLRGNRGSAPHTCAICASRNALECLLHGIQLGLKRLLGPQCPLLEKHIAAHITLMLRREFLTLAPGQLQDISFFALNLASQLVTQRTELRLEATEL